MKKIYIILFAAVALIANSCTKNYLEYNTDPYAATDAQMEVDDYLVQGSLKTLEGWVVPSEEHRFQFLEVLGSGTLNGFFAETVANWANKFSTFNVNDEWAADAFNEIIPAVFGARLQLSKITEDEVSLAVADICEVAVFAKLTDAYGPLPFSKLGADGSLVAPYDSQEVLYDSFFTKLDAAIAVLTNHSAETFNANSDIVFGGNIVKWVKYANTLKLRLAMRIVYVDEEKAQKKAEEAVNHSIGTLAENADNPEYTNPEQNRYYMLCHQWGDYRAAADIVSYMNGYKDPRREKYFTQVGGKYVGWRRGVAAADANKGANVCSNIVVEQNTRMTWMAAAEAAFLKAEGALRGWNMGKSAREWYEEGLRLSFDQWGVSGLDTYKADSSSFPEDYADPTGSGYDAGFLNQCRISPAWDASATFEANLERIITQKWIAAWRTEGMESWSEFRRTGYPKLLTAGVNYSAGAVPAGGFARRYPYPVNERTANTANYMKALEYLGGEDNMGTRLWWDCNPNTK